MKLHLEKLHSDILVKLANEEMSQTELGKELNISRSYVWILGNGNPPTLHMFIILIKWLGKDANTYIKK